MTSLYFDTETYSEVPIKHGTYKYLENAECMLAQFSFDKDAPTVVDFTDGQVLPKDVRQALTLGGVDIKAHNAMFDRNVVRYALNIDTPMDAWHCLMVRALQHGLPGGLDKLSEIFKLGVDAKDKDGKRLIQLFCKPMPKNSKIRRATKDTHPVEWAAFIEYARQDIPPVQRLDEILPRWNMTATERAYYLLDQRRNDRGMLVDLDLVKQCLRAVDAEQKRLKTETILATDGELMSTTQRAAMLEFILEQFGVSLPDLQSSTLELRLKDPDIPEEIKELLRIRLQVSTSSTSKYRALDRGVNLDGRLRGTIQFCGAQRTGRDAGRTFQPQNLPSRGLLPNGQVESGISAT
jgi:DNA polymerase